MPRLPFPLSRSGAEAEGLDYLAPGVRGYAIAGRCGTIYIPMLRAEREGSGDVGRFLDGLKRLPFAFAIPSVTSFRLRGMLERRGWVRIEEQVRVGEPYEGTWAEVWLLPTRSPPRPHLIAPRREAQEPAVTPMEEALMREEVEAIRQSLLRPREEGFSTGFGGEP